MPAINSRGYFAEPWDTVKLHAEIFKHVHGRTFGRISKFVATIAIVGAGIYIVQKIRAEKRRKNRQQQSRAKKDVVILHQFPRGLYAPSISPFPLKLETYLRMANLKYENDFTDFIGPKGKSPFITFNGEDIADSQLIIEFLNSKLSIDLNAKLSDVDKSVAHAFRIMIENYTYWGGALHRWVFDRNQTIMKISRWPFPWNFMAYHVVNKHMRKSSWYHGIGRHSEEEIMKMLKQDLQAISVFLGKKAFFMGDEPCEVDCAVFGYLGQLVWNFPGTVLEDFVNGEFSNLKDYCFRMKERYWDDWDSCLDPPRPRALLQ